MPRILLSAMPKAVEVVVVDISRRKRTVQREAMSSIECVYCNKVPLQFGTHNRSSPARNEAVMLPRWQWSFAAAAACSCQACLPPDPAHVALSDSTVWPQTLPAHQLASVFRI